MRTVLKNLAACVSIMAAFTLGAAAQGVGPGNQSGFIEWGVFVDPDGCMHWWADGGFEGVMVPRLHPKSGKPMCLRRNTCMIADADTFFRTDSAALTNGARAELKKVFSQSDVFGYAVYGHTDSRASRAYNKRLSERRAASVANYGRSVGAVIERQFGFGETRPRASNATAAGMRENRRVEIVCYRW